MVHRSTLAVLAAVLLSLGSVAAVAQTAKSAVQTAAAGEFDALDVNKDGYVDKGEAQALPGLGAVFDKADTKKTGKLDREQFAAAVAMIKR